MSAIINDSSVVSQFTWIHRAVDGQAVLRGRGYVIAKRIMDLVVTAALLPIALPAFLLCALLIKLESPGDPVLFIQERTGRGGKRFGMFKFRTMVVDAESLKQHYLALNELKWPDFKIKNDPRVTRVGRFLRKTSLDELPQIWNVVRGEMSYVGPRPTSFHSSTYSLWHTERLDALPGITGLWQVIGRGVTEFDDRLRLDIVYVNSRSLRLDIAILLRTIPSVLLQRGAC
jgi:lipopolysaccharide/colanic/teichoic acid biosynthesis glycosyltransferase